MKEDSDHTTLPNHTTQHRQLNNNIANLTTTSPNLSTQHRQNIALAPHTTSPNRNQMENSRRK